MRHAGLVLLAPFFMLTSACAPASDATPLELERLVSCLRSDAPFGPTPDGVLFEITRSAFVLVQLPGARVLELDLDARDPLCVSWMLHDGLPRLREYRALARGPATVRLDLSRCPDWRSESQPLLRFAGTGQLLVTAARFVEAPGDPDSFQACSDRGVFWAPEELGHTTINFLRPTTWSASRSTWLADRLAITALGLCVVVGVGIRLARRRWRLGLALATGALFATAAHDAYFLVRMLPALELVPEPDPEARIRDHYSFAPELGPLVALARSTLGPEERVGILAQPSDWFGPEVLGFNLAPRPCVVVKPGETVFTGLAGVKPLQLEELDAIIDSNSGEPLPSGFRTVVEIDPHRSIARRL